MQPLLRYRKTVGSLLTLLAFILQWAVVDHYESAAKRMFSSDETRTAELKEYTLEILSLTTKEPRYLSDALFSMTMRFNSFLSSAAFDQSAKEEKEKRARVLLLAMRSEPKTWEEYSNLKQTFL